MLRGKRNGNRIQPTGRDSPLALLPTRARVGALLSGILIPLTTSLVSVSSTHSMAGAVEPANERRNHPGHEHPDNDGPGKEHLAFPAQQPSALPGKQVKALMLLVARKPVHLCFVRFGRLHMPMASVPIETATTPCFGS